MDESETDVMLYQIWRSYDGEPFEPLENNLGNEITLDRNDADFGQLMFEYQIGPHDPDLMIIRGGGPEEAVQVELAVRAISTNLQESEFSDSILLEDITEPQVSNAHYNGTTDVTIMFNEPMDKTTAEDPSNYTFYDSADDEIEADIEEIVYDGHNREVVITLENSGDLTSNTGESVEVSDDVTDLAGNSLDEDHNSQGY